VLLFDTKKGKRSGTERGNLKKPEKKRAEKKRKKSKKTDSNCVNFFIKKQREKSNGRGMF
jgi:hypothetical protein